MRRWKGRVIAGRCDWVWERALAYGGAAKTVIARHARIKRSQIGAQLYWLISETTKLGFSADKVQPELRLPLPPCPFHKKPEITVYQNGVGGEFWLGALSRSGGGI